jgi:hypothetical protein
MSASFQEKASASIQKISRSGSEERPLAVFPVTTTRYFPSARPFRERLTLPVAGSTASSGAPRGVFLPSCSRIAVKFFVSGQLPSIAPFHEREAT